MVATASRTGYPAAAGHLPMQQAPQPDVPVYHVRLLRRARLGGRLFYTGQVVDITGRHPLRCAAGLVRTRQARPADEHTRLAVELFEAARQLPPC